MDVNAIITLVGSLGFPIAACIAMGFFVREMLSSHREESNKMTEAIQNNTLVIQKLIDKMEGDGK